jgi:enamine deaminase RidA (YjgF/YER057c/UK114 family)
MRTLKMTITYLNPDTLHTNPAFTQVAIVEAPTKMIYVGGQNAVNTEGEIVGSDIESQTTQTMKNLIAALDAAGATLGNVFKMTIYIVQGQSLQEGFEAFSQSSDKSSNPPTISVIFVTGLAHPEFLIEIDAVAAI